MKAIGIKDRVTFSDYYLAPALKLGLVEMTQPKFAALAHAEISAHRKGEAFYARRAVGIIFAYQMIKS